MFCLLTLSLSRHFVSYQRALKQKPCMHYNFGRGTCPFGSSCFYLHINEDGSLAQEPKLRTVTDSSGNYGVLKEVKLSDFF